MHIPHTPRGSPLQLPSFLCVLAAVFESMKMTTMTRGPDHIIWTPGFALPWFTYLSYVISCYVLPNLSNYVAEWKIVMCNMIVTCSPATASCDGNTSAVQCTCHWTLSLWTKLLLVDILFYRWQVVTVCEKSKTDVFNRYSHIQVPRKSKYMWIIQCLV